MKIGIVSEHANPLAAIGGADAGGQNVHVAALAAELARRGHEVAVYTRQENQDQPRQVTLGPRVTVWHVPAGPPRVLAKDQLFEHMPQFADWLADHWNQQPPEIVHGHFWMSGFASLRAAGDRIPVVQTFHALGIQKRRYQGDADTSPRQRIRTEAGIGRRARAIIATCTEEVRELEGYGIGPERTFVVPCGVDTGLFRPDGSPRLHGHDPWPQPGRRARVLAIGRLVRRKAVDTVVAALAQAPQAQLLVAGGPPADQLERDPEVSRLREIAREAGVADRVAFCGSVQHQQVPTLMRAADVIVSAPWYEPFGIVPLEAMACGRPVIASAVGGHLDTVTHGRTGFLVPPRNPAALAGRLRALLARPELAAAFGEQGVRRVRIWYTWERVAAETEAVYRHVRAGAQADGPTATVAR